MAVNNYNIARYNPNNTQKTVLTATPAANTPNTSLTTQAYNNYKNGNINAAQNMLNTSVGKSGNVMTNNTKNPMTQQNNNAAIRSTMTGSGMNNDLIGFDQSRGMVTYGGKDFIKADHITDGASYANPEYLKQAIGGYFNDNGYTSVPGTLKNRGIVSYDASSINSPYNLNGEAYAKMSDVNKLTNEEYAKRGNPLVAATDYAAGSGLRNIVQWTEDGRCLVGGKPVEAQYVTDDGIAMVTENDIKKALNEYKNNNGILGDEGVYDKWSDKYGSKINKQLNKVLNRDEWDYDPYKDPAYLSYRDQYAREGNRAFQDAYAQMAGAASGYGSSAAVTAGGQQLNYYMQQLNDRVPELQQNSWNRYVQDYDMNRQALDDLLAVGNDDYNKLYTQNNDAYNRANEASDTAYERRQSELYDKPLRQEAIKQAKQQTFEGDVDTKYYETLKKLEVENYDTQTKQLLENLGQSKVENAFKQAYAMGYFTKETGEKAGYTARYGYPNYEKYPETGYPNPREGEAISDLYYWKNYGKHEFQDQADITR